MLTTRSIVLGIAAPLVPAAAGIAHPHGLSRSTASDRAQLHIALLLVFPLLTIGLLVPLRHRPRPGLAGFATVAAWAGAFVYAAFCTGLDAVAGIAVEYADETANLGQAGAYALICAIAATAVALLPKHGARILPGTVVLLAAGWSFVDSHIFWPRGVWTMLGFALGFALLAWGTRRSASTDETRVLPRRGAA